MPLKEIGEDARVPPAGSGPSSGPGHETPGGTHSDRRALRAVVGGNAIEWYEFALYALLATYLGRAFFPTEDPLASAIGAWNVFAIAFVVRPFGGLALGWLGDRVGRRALLVITVSGMGVATVAIGLVPDYDTIGIAAPLIVLGLRAIQGSSAGAEMAAAVAYLDETSRRGRISTAMGVLGASTYAASGAAGILVAVLTAVLGDQEMTAWGWRLPFVLALPLAASALWLRRSAPDDRTMPLPAAPEPSPSLRTRSGLVLRYLAVAGVYNIAASAVYGGYLTHARLADADPAMAQTAAAVMLLATAITALVAGRMVHLHGSRTVMVCGTASLGLVAWPAFLWGSTSSSPLIILGGLLLSVPVGLIVAPAYLLIAQLFPRSTRLTAGSLAYNLTALLGGLTPLTVLLIRQGTGFTLAYPVVLVAAALASLALTLHFHGPASGQARP